MLKLLLELRKLVNYSSNLRFELQSADIVSCRRTEDQDIQGYLEALRKLNKEIHRAAFTPGLDPTQKTLVDVQLFSKALLRIAVLNTELADTLSALHDVIIHFL